jgi:fucose 4-O-acetylase-like acetyltransferase
MNKPTEPQRYYALDCLRGAAMLLGVFYHSILFAGMVGRGGPPGPGGPGGPFGTQGVESPAFPDITSLGFLDWVSAFCRWLPTYFTSMRTADWLHSFRMPLFFLIAGFFCRMMYWKYGTFRYVTRRWLRLGLPMLVALFTIVPIYQMTLSAGMGGPPGGGMGRPGMGGPPPGMGMGGPPPGIGMGGPPPGIGMGGPPPGIGMGGPPPGIGMGGPPPGIGMGGPPPGIGGGGPPGFGAPGGGGPPGPGGPMPFGPPGFGPGATSNSVGAKLFGENVRYFILSNLWFLWYLLVFATAAPIVATILQWIVVRPTGGLSDRVGRGLFKYGLAPLGLGLVCVPALMWSGPSFFGWTLGLASGIWLPFPDFFYTFPLDMIFYALYFLCGWWLHRERDALPTISSCWFPCLVIGLAAFAGSAYLSDTYSRQNQLPNYERIRLAGYALYTVAGAYTTFAFLGFFQMFVNHPTRVGRYLADTAFWIYLIHQPLLLPVLRWLGPVGLSWWLQAPLATLLTTMAALLLYEAAVRPTPLVRLFGPAAGSRAKPTETVVIEPEPVQTPEITPALA